MTKHWFNKLSFQITTFIIVFITLAVIVFSLLYSTRESFFELTREMGFIKENTENHASDIIDRLKEQDVSINDTATIERLLGESDIYTVILYNKANNLVVAGSFATMLDNLIVGFTTYDTDAIYDGDEYYTELEFKDGSVEMYVYSYALAKLVVPYLAVSLIIALATFIVPVYLFIKKKFKALVSLKDDVTKLAFGDLENNIIINTNDEIGALSHQIDDLRLTLKNNQAFEEANRKANYELVTALSHDIRTPLTSLQGYLEIIRLKKYKNEQQYNLYLNNSIDKVNQINELANKMFEYFLVFSKEQDTELSKISLGVIYEYVLENIGVLEENGFTVIKKIGSFDYFIRGNINLIKRIINNIFSNVLKYADVNEPININFHIDESSLVLIVKNTKKQTFNYIESNQIGLKSVKQMLKIHDGNFIVNDNENSFEIMITIPLIN